MFSWNANTLRFRADAEAFLGFDKAIAARIIARTRDFSHMCDAGCGTGFMSLAFAERFTRVSAVDVSSEALSLLRRNAERLGIENVHPICRDLFSMAPSPAERYSAMTFCFFGSTDECLRAIRSQCAGQAFLVRKNWSTRRFTSPGAPLTHSNFEAVKHELKARGVPFGGNTFTLDLGQPFRSLEDARLFFSEYGGEKNVPSLAELEAMLMPTSRADFPFLLQELRSVGLIEIDAEDARQHETIR